LNKNLYWGKDKTETVSLKPKREFSKKFKIGFVRGLIDTDGYRRPDHRRYVFTSASESLVKNKKNILEELNISFTEFKENDPRGYRTKYKIRITGKDVVNFNDKIQPRNPKRQY